MEGSSIATVFAGAGCVALVVLFGLVTEAIRWRRG
jgi:hypothetical protein